MFSYVNNIPTNEGGTHEKGFRSAVTKVMNDYCRRVGVLKEKDRNHPGEDFREGMAAVLSVRMKDVQFEGQTRPNSAIPKAESAVEAVIVEGLTHFTQDLRNAELRKDRGKGAKPPACAKRQGRQKPSSRNAASWKTRRWWAN